MIDYTFPTLTEEQQRLLAASMTMLDTVDGSILRPWDEPVEPDEPIAFVVNQLHHVFIHYEDIATDDNRTLAERRQATTTYRDAHALVQRWRELFVYPDWERGAALTVAQVAILFGLKPSAIRRRWIPVIEPGLISNDGTHTRIECSALRMSYQQEKRFVALRSSQESNSDGRRVSNLPMTKQEVEAVMDRLDSIGQ